MILDPDPRHNLTPGDQVTVLTGRDGERLLYSPVAIVMSAEGSQVALAWWHEGKMATSVVRRDDVRCGF